VQDLLDVNVWVALSILEHPHHEQAMTYWETQAASKVVFCRATALGFVRVCSGKNAVGGRPLPLSESWRHYQNWRKDERILLLEDPSGVEMVLSGFFENLALTNRLWTDAYLAAFAVAGDLRLVTFDKDFERFPGLTLLRL
jgi:toxin-antitoxin system PIN domain toxin